MKVPLRQNALTIGLRPVWSVALWPQPRDLRLGSTALLLSADFEIDLGKQDVPQDVKEAVERTRHHLYTDNLERLVVGRCSADTLALDGASMLPALIVELGPGVRTTDAALNALEAEIQVQVPVQVQAIGFTNSTTSTIRSIAEDTHAPPTERDEAYTLEVPADGSPALLRSGSALGFLRGLTTFEQIWYSACDSTALYTLEAPLTISDSPAYVS